MRVQRLHQPTDRKQVAYMHNARRQRVLRVRAGRGGMFSRGNAGRLHASGVGTATSTLACRNQSQAMLFDGVRGKATHGKTLVCVLFLAE